MLTHESLDEAVLLQRDAAIRRLAFSILRNRADAEDVVQDVWVSSLRFPPRDPAALPAWIGRVVRSIAWRRIHRASLRPRVEAAASQLEDSGDPIADALSREESRRIVHDAVMDMAEPYRTAIVLRYFEALSPREIGRKTGCPTETVRTRLQRGLKQLRARLGSKDRSWVAVLLPLTRALPVRQPIWVFGAARAALALLLVAPAIWIATPRRDRAPATMLAPIRVEAARSGQASPTTDPRRSSPPTTAPARAGLGEGTFSKSPRGASPQLTDEAANSTIEVIVVDTIGRPMRDVPVVLGERGAKRWPNILARAVTRGSPPVARLSIPAQRDSTRLALSLGMPSSTQVWVPVGRPSGPMDPVTLRLGASGSIRVRLSGDAGLPPSTSVRVGLGALTSDAPDRSEDLDWQTGQASDEFVFRPVGVDTDCRLVAISGDGSHHGELWIRGPDRAGDQLDVVVSVARVLAVHGALEDEEGRALRQIPLQLSLSASQTGPSRGRGSATTDDRGRFLVLLEHPTALDLPVEHVYVDARSQRSKIAANVAASTTHVELGVIRLHAPPLVAAGRVVDPTGAPAAGASVQLRPVLPAMEGPPSIATVRADDDGRFEYRASWAAGQIALTASTADWIDERDLVVPAGDSGALIRLVAASQLGGRLLLPDGVTRDRVRILVAAANPGTDALSEPPQSNVESDGTFTVPTCRPGVHAVTFLIDGRPRRRIERVECPAGGPSTDPRLVAVDLSSESEWVTVRVVDPQGNPLAGACVIYSDNSNLPEAPTDLWSDLTDANGAVRAVGPLEQVWIYCEGLSAMAFGTIVSDRTVVLPVAPTVTLRFHDRVGPPRPVVIAFEWLEGAPRDAVRDRLCWTPTVVLLNGDRRHALPGAGRYRVTLDGRSDRAREFFVAAGGSAEVIFDEP